MSIKEKISASIILSSYLDTLGSKDGKWVSAPEDSVAYAVYLIPLPAPDNAKFKWLRALG